MFFRDPKGGCQCVIFPSWGTSVPVENEQHFLDCRWGHIWSSLPWWGRSIWGFFLLLACICNLLVILALVVASLAGRTAGRGGVGLRVVLSPLSSCFYDVGCILYLFRSLRGVRRLSLSGREIIESYAQRGSKSSSVGTYRFTPLIVIANLSGICFASLYRSLGFWPLFVGALALIATAGQVYVALAALSVRQKWSLAQKRLTYPSRALLRGIFLLQTGYIVVVVPTAAGLLFYFSRA